MSRSMQEAWAKILNAQGSDDPIGSLLSPRANSLRLALRERLRARREARFGKMWGGNNPGITMNHKPKTNFYTYAYKDMEQSKGDTYSDASDEFEDEEFRKWLSSVGQSIYERQHADAYGVGTSAGRSANSGVWEQWDLPPVPEKAQWGNRFSDTAFGKFLKKTLKTAGYFNTQASALHFVWNTYDNFRNKGDREAGIDPRDEKTFVGPPAPEGREEAFNLLTNVGVSNEFASSMAQDFADGKYAFKISDKAVADMSPRQLSLLNDRLGGNAVMSNQAAHTTFIESWTSPTTRAYYDKSIESGYGYATRLKPRELYDARRGQSPFGGAGGKPPMKDEPPQASGEDDD